MKTLIVFYSLTQNNEKVARELQRRLGCDIWRIKEKKNRKRLSIFLDVFFKRIPTIEPVTINLSRYEHIILPAKNPKRTYSNKNNYEKYSHSN